MISNKTDLTDFITTTLKPYGFKKRSNIWYLETEECISALALNKSSWSNQFYLDVLLVVKALSKGTILKSSSDGEIMWRIDELFEEKRELNEYLDFENVDILSQLRETVLNNALINQALPFLQKLTTVDGIKDMVNKYPKFKYCISDRLWNYLNLNVSRENPPSNENEKNTIKKNPFVIKTLGENDLTKNI